MFLGTGQAEAKGQKLKELVCLFSPNSLTSLSILTKTLHMVWNGGSDLLSQLLRRQRSGEWWFKASPEQKLKTLSER
jgi:hypothetical protein